MLAARSGSRYAPLPMATSTRTWAIRAVLALVALLAVGLGIDRLTHRGARAKPCMRVMTAAEAGRAQQGQPTTHAEALRQVDAQIAFARQQMAAATPDATEPFASFAALELARGQLTGDYTDFERGRLALENAFARAPAGLGPRLLRATYNMTLHRLAPIDADLTRIEHYRMPDPGDVAAATGMRGDMLFYRGDYKAAKAFYDRADAAGGGSGTKVRLATWYAKMGDSARAASYLDQAACAVSGPQQQLQGFIAMQRGSLAMDHGDWDGAQAAFERAAAIFPDFWATEFQLASVLGLKGDLPHATALLTRIAQRDHVPDAYDALAGLQRARGDFAGATRTAAVAEGLWRQRIALFPEAAYGHAVTHYLYFGDPKVALDLAERNYRARPYAPSATVLATALLANGRAPDALRVLKPVLASGWVSADAQVAAAETYALLGQGEASDAARKQALAINPHSFDRNVGLTWLEH